MESDSQALALARQHHQAGHLNQAEASYQQVLRSDPNQAEALQGLSGIAFHRGQYTQAIAWQRQAVALQSSNAWMHNNLGRACLAAGQQAEAEACFRQALRLMPDLAESYYNLGNLLKERGQWKEAEARYQQAILIQPTYVDAHLQLCVAWRKQGRREGALAQLRQAARARPDHSDVHGLLGLVLRDLGQREEAIAHLQQAQRLKPSDARPHFHLAETLQEEGRWEESVTPLREAVRLQQHWAEAHRLLGRALARVDRLAEATTYLQQALRLKPAMAGLHADLGEVLQRQGDFDAALAHFLAEPPSTPPKEERPAVPAMDQKVPDQPAPIEDALAPALGLRKQGRLDEAAAAFEAAVKQAPDSARARYELGVTRALNKQRDEAIAQYRESVRLDPDLAEAHHALGVALGEQEDLPEAITAFHHAVRVKPDFAEAYVNLGKAFRDQGDLERSAAYLRHALRLRPEFVEAYYKLGLVLSDQGKREEAVTAFREALRLQPEAIAPLSKLGDLLLELGQFEEGSRLLEQALATAPKDAEVHAHYGRALLGLGRLEEGKAHFLQALELQPEYASAYFLLARDSNHQFTDAEMSRIQELLNRDQLPSRARIDLHFALARIYDRAKAFDEAFRHCDQGNAHQRELLRRQGNSFRPESHARYVDQLLATFDAAYFDRVRSFGVDSDLPVFIVGMPRSGTSLVEQILASHPAVFGAGESGTLSRFVAELPAELASAASFPPCLTSLDANSARHLAETYLHKLRRLGGEKIRVTDKTVTNTHFLGLIATLWPRAHIIRCRRDPRDVGWSCYFQHFRDVTFACDLRALGAYYRQYERLMAHWKAVLPLPIYEVCYEELVEEPERISREMIAFCRLPWDDACLRFHETPRAVRTSSDIQVRRPISRKAVDYWKNYASHLGPLIEALNGS
jgi:tetratricopeptide (TPR) repeat protein